MDSSLFLLHLKESKSENTNIGGPCSDACSDTGMGEGGDSLRLRLRVSCDQSAGRATPGMGSQWLLQIYTVVTPENGKENSYRKKEKMWFWGYPGVWIVKTGFIEI